MSDTAHDYLSNRVADLLDTTYPEDLTTDELAGLLLILEKARKRRDEPTPKATKLRVVTSVDAHAQ